MPGALGAACEREASRGRRGSLAYLVQLVPRVLQARPCTAPMHSLSLGHRDPPGPQGPQGRMVPPEGTVNRGIPVKMADLATLGRRASRGPQETWAPRVRRGILVLGQEDPQDPKGLQDHQDPHSDLTS